MSRHINGVILMSFLCLLTVNNTAGSPWPGEVLVTPERSRPNPPTETIPPADLAFLAEISRRQPFLEASTDPAREPQSLDRFFTRAIYEQLHGNDYFGYTHDEGFTWTGRHVTLERIHTLPETQLFHDALAASLGAALEDHGVDVTADAPVRLGLALVGVEYAATPDTVPGVMLEVYFRHTGTGRAFFWRVGIGSRAGLPAALVDALDLVVTLLLSLRHD